MECKCKNYIGQYAGCPIETHKTLFYKEALKQTEVKLSKFLKPTFWFYIKEVFSLLTNNK